MALIKVKPTSPGRRAVVKVVTPELHKGKPVAALVESQSRNAGRNHNGHITTRHQGGGHKQHYRVVDFRRNKDGIPAVVERLEYDPNRTAHLALLCYKDGERRYIIAAKGLTLDHTLCRNAAREGRSACSFGWHLGATTGARRRLRTIAPALRRNPQSACGLPRYHR
jgi:ribosomal protein L2